MYYIDDQKKCFAVDKKIKKAAIGARSVTDFILILEVAYKVCSSSILELCPNSKMNANAPLTFFGHLADVSKRVPWMNVLVDFLALLPFPQIILVVVFTSRKGIKYFENKWRLIFLPLFQFVPRTIRIYVLCKKFSRSVAPNDITGTGQFRGTFNFLLFILLVFGAFWYCFSVLRELYCWQSACKFNSGCRVNSFFCEDITGNERFVDKFCPINPPNSTIFDFGLFLNAHQSGVTRVNDFPVKLLYCFSWGLRALSSFGSNLTTSSYACENIFAALVTIVGILLVVYLIGNLQVYLQSSTLRSEEKRRTMKKKGVEIDFWIDYYKFQKKKEIKEFVIDKFEWQNDVNLKTLLDVFPSPFVEEIKKELCWDILKRVPMLKEFEEEKLTKMMKDMKPMVFGEQSYIIREGEPIEQMLLFTKGMGLTFSKSTGTRTTINTFGKGDLFGEQLLDWAAGNLPTFEIPLSKCTLKTQTQMEAFALKAIDPQYHTKWDINMYRDVKIEYRQLKKKVKEYNKRDAQFYDNIFTKMNKLEHAKSIVICLLPLIQCHIDHSPASFSYAAEAAKDELLSKSSPTLTERLTPQIPIRSLIDRSTKKARRRRDVASESMNLHRYFMIYSTIIKHTERAKTGEDENCNRNCQGRFLSVNLLSVLPPLQEERAIDETEITTAPLLPPSFDPTKCTSSDE
ncbi:cyclic nucleotide-gated ion channel 1-like isoform X1 [Cucumis melo var. makuwa]|uniref:Cyclic nucleotide-gated ion channel 1-like isoform X1 n=1 Tax=Cucumis melo var. makuwa TaxID=1194695 RepID=A0A5D3E6K4_CUCMM|nr:cyclic nucleotide-gated ion channel 1-like isoform X1 [Cucumis melo var. makuwa]